MSTARNASEGLQQGQGQRAGAGRGFWPWWVLLTTAGYAFGMGLDSALYSGMGAALSGVADGVVSTALYGAVAGGLSGVLQTLLLRSRLERSYEWALVSMAGGVAGFVLGSAGGEIASNIIGVRLDVYLTGTIIQIVFGAFSGAGIGLAQWLLIRRRVANAGTWVPANVVGLTFGFSIPVGLMQLVSLPLLGVWFGLAGGLLLGLTEWLWSRRIAW